MKYLGIDYGTKKIGLATSDESGTLAFPAAIIPNSDQAISQIKKLCADEKVGSIVIGESATLEGQPNPIMALISDFKMKLKELGLPVESEREFLTTVEARRYQEGEVDSSAAALILQRYLDKLKFKL
jgi:putative Holliday junction resolvase